MISSISTPVPGKHTTIRGGNPKMTRGLQSSHTKGKGCIYIDSTYVYIYIYVEDICRTYMGLQVSVYPTYPRHSYIILYIPNTNSNPKPSTRSPIMAAVQEPWCLGFGRLRKSRGTQP